MKREQLIVPCGFDPRKDCPTSCQNYTYCWQMIGGAASPSSEQNEALVKDLRSQPPTTIESDKIQLTRQFPEMAKKCFHLKPQA